MSRLAEGKSPIRAIIAEPHTEQLIQSASFLIGTTRRTERQEPGSCKQHDKAVQIHGYFSVEHRYSQFAIANEMIRQHGQDAPIHAAMRADKLMEDGELDGARTWRLIVHRVEELLREPSGTLN